MKRTFTVITLLLVFTLYLSGGEESVYSVMNGSRDEQQDSVRSAVSPQPAETDSKDSLVRLIRAAGSVRLYEKDGISYRKVVGPALFMHNNTYLECDTAIQNVESGYIDAVGNVRIIQKNTVLSSDSLHYIVDSSLAQFRGYVVELNDADSNLLRTRNLDYYTKDSVAVFYDGGALVDSDGNVIESIDGRYDSKAKTFTFKRNVKMYSSGMMILSSRLDYKTAEDRVYLGRNTRIWNDDNFLASDAGIYERTPEIIHFTENCYILTPDQEIFSDSLSYYRLEDRAELFKDVQIEDKEQSVLMFGDYAYYLEKPFKAYLTRNPAFAMYGYENGQPDTLFMSSDTLMVYKKMYMEVDSMEIVNAQERSSLSRIDPVQEARKKGASGNASSSQENGPGRGAPGAPRGTMQQGASGGMQGASGAVQSPRGGQSGSGPKSAPQSGNSVPGSSTVPSASAEDKANVPAESKKEQADSSSSVAPSSVPSDTASVSVALAGADSTGAVEPVVDSLSSDGSMPADTSSVQDMTGQVQTAVADTAGAGSGIQTDSSAVATGLQMPVGKLADSVEVLDSAALAQLEAERIRIADSTRVADSLAAVKLARDTSLVTFLRAHHHVKFYRKDMQGMADSLIYTSLDSITRLYKKPVMWNEGKNQFSSDSMQIITEEQTLRKANLLGTAFVISMEGENYFNQIKSTEMTAFFENSELVRFDALGGVSAIFYLKEKDVISTMNQKESKMLTVSFRDNQVERLHYIESIKNDAVSVFGLAPEKLTLRDFAWRMDERPRTRFDVCDRPVRKSRRLIVEDYSLPDYSETDFYFDGYMTPKRDSVIAAMEYRDSVRRAERLSRTETENESQKREEERIESEKYQRSKEQIKKTIVSETKTPYFVLYLNDNISGKLTNVKVSNMKVRWREVMEAIAREEKEYRKFVKKNPEGFSDK